MPDAGPTDVLPHKPRASLARSAAVGCVLGALLACTAELGRMIVDRNKHVVIPGRVHRTAQLSPAQLERYVREYEIQTVVNLRGRPFGEWYPAEAQTTQTLGVSQEDVTLSAHRLPSSNEIRRLVEIFDRSEHPMVIHCQQGADRTGLAAAMYLLLYTDADYATARRQCSPRFGHVPILAAAAMGEFFDLYEEWLSENGREHTSERFRRWATAEYCPGPARARLELVNPPQVVEVGRPVVFLLRAHNTSHRPWHFKPGTRAGVHAGYTAIYTDEGMVVHHADWAGYMDAVVPPGRYIDLPLAVPPPAKAGRYMLWVDLSFKKVSFTQYGSEPLTYDWEARNPTPVRGR